MKHIESAHIINTGGNVMCAYGKLTSGEYFGANMNEEIMLYDSEENAFDGFMDEELGFLGIIWVSDPDFYGLWMEIYNKAEDSWKVSDWYKCELMEMTDNH